MTASGFLSQLLQLAVALLLAPALVGWVNQCRAWLANRSAPPLLTPYRTIRKLFHKDAVVAENASAVFRLTPYVVFGAMALAAAIVPSLATDLPFASAADAIALVGLFALARVFIALAAMDIGTAFGSLGARREMFVGFLAEPALLMVLFTASLISGSTSLPTIVENLAHREIAIYPSLAFAGRVLVTPPRLEDHSIDLKALVDEVCQRGVGLPLLLRFSDILRSRIDELNRAFQQAIKEYGYQGVYRGVYPIKVNQESRVVEEVVRFGRPYHHGLEAGSKPELLAVLAMLVNLLLGS